MAEAIWAGSGSAVSGTTPFGLYDADSEFQTEAPNFATWCARRLGYPIIDIEMPSGSFYACYEKDTNNPNGGNIPVLDCEPNNISINNAIQKLYSTEFQDKLNTVKNPYGSGGASEAIVNILECVSLDGILKKKFYDYV